MTEKLSTRDMTREEWLATRRNTIGGSDAAGIVGLNPYTSPYSIWAVKCGLVAEAEDSEAMRTGRDLEDYVAQRFTEATGKKVRRDRNIIYNSAYPFAHANIDRAVVGEDAGLECKTTTTLNLKKYRDGEYPDNYYVQCMHYMMVTGKARWYLAVLVLGKGFFWFVIERNEEEIKALAQAEEEFYEHVKTGVPPIPDGTSATTSAIGSAYQANAYKEAVNLVGLDEAFETIEKLSATIKTLEAAKDEAANRIKATLGEATAGYTGRYSCTWNAQTRKTFSADAFKAAMPGVDLSPYYKESTARVFIYKINKEA